jgi:hypothetical protein
MKKKRVIFIIVLVCILSSCNGNNKEPNVDTIVEITKFNQELYINILGLYAHGNCYDYLIKTIENVHILLVTKYNIKEKYGKLLSDNEMYDIYNFIKEHEIENEIEIITNSWLSSGDFVGSFILDIDGEKYDYGIRDHQEIENNLYTVLNFLNTQIENDEYFMPIVGVKNGSKY